MKNRQWILKNRPHEGMKASDFEMREMDLPELEEGQALLKNLYLSFDPTQRLWASVDTYRPAVPLGTVMSAMGVGQVVETKNSKFKKGDLFFGLVEWQEYCIIDSKSSHSPFKFALVPPYIDIPLYLSLIITGFSAYIGIEKIGKVKRGETLLVSGAAGAVGSIAGQMGKLKGAKVVGIAGGEEKCRWLKEELHFDGVIDYKRENVEKKIGELCPNRIDVFFDNVGGDALDGALQHLAKGARIVICGQISEYDKLGSSSDAKTPSVLGRMSLLIPTGARIEGFLCTDWVKNCGYEAILTLNEWVGKGAIQQKIDCREGFENIPDTLIGVLHGKNIGKQLLKLSSPPLPLNKSFVGALLFKIFQKFIVWKTGVS